MKPNWFSEKINKIDKTLAKIIKKAEGPNKIKSERDMTTPQKHKGGWDTTMNNDKIANKLDNLAEMNKFLGTYKLSRLNQEKI